uniref:C-type lectin domain-containing protein n=1 Tax=Acrobeloides nanus TaxID=290746 RepID=A0A914EFL8_9BILA
MKLHILALFSLLGYALSACPSGTVSIPGKNDRCYKVFSTPKTWQQAENTCKADGAYSFAHLASVSDAITSHSLTELIGGQLNGSDFWLGGRSLYQPWTWSDDQSFGYKNWAKGQPNNTIGFDAAYLLQRAQDAKWMSVDGSQEKPFVCEYDLLTPCGEDWFYSTDLHKCYHFEIKNVSWSDALSTCQKLHPNASLGTIHSLTENSNIVELFNTWIQVPPPLGYTWWLWIGLHKVQANQDFEWVDGTSFNFNYIPQGNGNYTCVHINPDYGVQKGESYEYGHWYSDECDPDNLETYQNFGYICEMFL